MRTLLSRNFTIRTPLAAFSAGRSERPEGATDTTEFWSRGVQNSTQARKFRVDAVHAGRSMIEMLGVLALVGVLSVGGIAGYSKAMWMYKTNKQAEQIGGIINTIIQNRKRFHDKTSNYYSLIPILKNMGEIPLDMYTPYPANHILDVFTVRYEILHGAYSHLKMGATLFKSRFNSKDMKTLCSNLYHIGKNFSQDIYYLGIVINGYSCDRTSLAYGDKYCSSGRKCLKDLAPHDIDSICQLCADNSSCYINFDLGAYN